MTYDLLIKYGTVIDGTGAPGVVADVGVSGGRITAIEPRLEGSAAREIDAVGGSWHRALSTCTRIRTLPC